MSKKLQNKRVQCLMCPKKINCEKESESWFALYDLMSMNEHFIKSQGEA